MAPSRVYLDHNATTPLHPRVIRLMRSAMRRVWANPSSAHADGRAARRAVERARGRVSAFLSVRPDEIVFTSGGTESNNMAILGMASALSSRGSIGQVIGSPLDHPSVREAVPILAHYGFRVKLLSPDGHGRLDPDDLRRGLLQRRTSLVTLALVNHEIGNIYPITEYARLCHEHGAILHCDAVQAVGRVPVDVRALGVDLMTVSAHKLYGPKGVGALFVRGLQGRCNGDPEGLNIGSILIGGMQEGGVRAGTENTVSIIGFGRACQIAALAIGTQGPRITALRDRLEERLLAIPGARCHGDREPGGRAPGTCNLAFAGVSGDDLMRRLDRSGVSVSTGAACRAGLVNPSPVLLALGFDQTAAKEAVRFSLGAGNTAEEIEQVAELVEELVLELRHD